jgi:hypothetical protein
MNFRFLGIGILLSFALAASPILMVLLSWAWSGFSGQLLSEGDGGHGIWLWYFFYTVPGACVTLLISIIGSFIAKPKTSPPVA